MINETILAVLLSYGVFAWGVVDKVKPTIKKILAGWQKAAWEPYAFQVAAVLVVAALLAGDGSTRVFAIIGRTPQNQVWELIDFALTLILAFQTNEAAHRLIDAGRSYLGLKEESPNV